MLVLHIHDNTENYSFTILQCQNKRKPCIATETGWLQLLILSAASTLATLNLYIFPMVSMVTFVVVDSLASKETTDEVYSSEISKR